MCGIFGVTSNSAIDKVKFNKSLDLLAHRSPDLSQSYFKENIAFGFRRLAIQDLSNAGDQPMHSENYKYSLLFNGEIYNFHELRKELCEQGLNFRSNSDAEVLFVFINKMGC